MGFFLFLKELILELCLFFLISTICSLDLIEFSFWEFSFHFFSLASVYCFFFLSYFDGVHLQKFSQKSAWDNFSRHGWSDNIFILALHYWWFDWVENSRLAIVFTHNWSYYSIFFAVSNVWEVQCHSYS